MDKGTYETYEFLPTNNVGHESDQFLVVQEDGTFLITKQIQYVTQEQVNKEIPVNSVPVYDIQPQQYLVNVNNTADFIMPEQLMLPNGSNNLYTNSYLLQTGATTTPTEQVADATDQYRQVNTEVAPEPSNKQTNNCTEITLSDEQYQMLEQKGWILLESNDKIYVLNTLGLHDITTNYKLVNKLRNQAQNNLNVETSSGCNKTDVIPNEDLTTKQASVEIVADEETTQHDRGVCFIVDEKDDEPKQEDFHDDCDTQSPNATVHDETIEVFREQDSNSIKIKTKFVFKNIPNKIILGKTANGKRIVAKMIKKDKPVTICHKTAENKLFSGLDLSEAQFLALIQQALRSYSDTFCAEDITTANAVILQLLKVSTLKQIIIGQNIIVTKGRARKDKNGKLLKHKISLLTGKIHSNDKEECFTHIPDLLHSLLLRPDSHKPNMARPIAIIDNDLAIFHIHVSELVSEDNVVRVHINLAKRQFAIDSVLDHKLRRPQTTYACGACAATFKTSEALREHLEGQCTETEDNLTIDIDMLNKDKQIYSILKTGKEKLYSCLQCDAKFARISHCQKHVKTHFAPTSPLNSDTATANSEQMNVEMEREVYKCKMCPATFYHPSTLSRHIVSRHIKLKEN